MKPKHTLEIVLLSLGLGLFQGCSQDASEFPKEETLTPGIFLEPEMRAVLPQGVELRKVYDKGIELTKESEGFRSKPYNDAANYCTIAYGHLIKLAPCDMNIPSELRHGVTVAQGTELLRTDMGKAEIAVMTLTKVGINDGQFAALCDFVFNVGTGNFKSSTLLKVVNRGDFDGVPFQLRRWVKAGGRELPGLVARREKEIELFFDGLPIPRAAPPAEMDLSEVDIRSGEGG